MKPEPPEFQEANRCDVCKCSFTTFRRRHHCRCCGRTLCSEHSSNQMPLPQFGIHSNVRVCSDCFNTLSKSTADGSGPSPDKVDSISEAVTRLDMNGASEQNLGSTSLHSPAVAVPDCKCGMPLCICEVSLPPTPAAPVQTVASSSLTSSAKSKKPEGTRQRRSAQDSRQGDYRRMWDKQMKKLDVELKEIWEGKGKAKASDRSESNARSESVHGPRRPTPEAEEVEDHARGKRPIGADDDEVNKPAKGSKRRKAASMSEARTRKNVRASYSRDDGLALVDLDPDFDGRRYRESKDRDGAPYY